MEVEISAIIIAVLSFFLSLYVIYRDRKNKNLDNLFLSRQRILDAFNDREVLTVDEMVYFFEENPDSEEAQKHKAISADIKYKVDREFEFACYLVIKKQINLNLFFDLFGKWLAMREIIWNSMSTYKKHNFSYTWRVIDLCKKRGLLPLNKKLPTSPDTGYLTHD